MSLAESADTRNRGSGSGTWARRFLVLVLIGFSIGAVANVVMEVRFKPENRALLVHPSGTLSTVTGTEFGAVRGKYWAATVVHDVAWGGVLIVPDESLVSPTRFPILANMAVSVDDYCTELTPEMVDSLGGLPAVRGVGNIAGNDGFVPFSVVWSPEGTPVPVLRLWYFGDEIYLIDDRVITPEMDR